MQKVFNQSWKISENKMTFDATLKVSLYAGKYAIYADFCKICDNMLQTHDRYKLVWLTYEPKII